ncbi:hypothetical protein CYMTET_36611 [Cymbomonas tetramitiformis]|uniref:Uncharacterized protein n=1 Tax=Cymbomonas tetramitiformis TaxID=36881 RepID=A0AAE0F797_9CHLO|nr:hypothetical protein CYMTET_36611 [Cymbomonas tetramitiformis]
MVIQTGFVTVYAIFFNFQKFNKAIAVGLVALITVFWKGSVMKGVITGFLDFLRGCYAKVAYLCQMLRFVLLGEKIVPKYYTKRVCAAAAVAVQVVWGQGGVGGQSFGEMAGFGLEAKVVRGGTGFVSSVRGGLRGEGGASQSEQLLADIHLVSPLEAQLQKVAYFLLLVSWIIITWVLLTYSMLIREMMGTEAETELIGVWATTLVVEMFGVETLKLIGIRLVVDEVMRRVEEAFTGVDWVQKWYERHIIAIAAGDLQEGEADGDQDLGDDADYDGGEGFGGDNDTDTGNM